MTGSGDGAAPVVVARGLTKRFGDFTAVDGIDFAISQGEAFGFLGPNGAGKTSTMRMIACLSPLSDGSLEVLGMDPTRQGSDIRAQLGLVPQDDTLDLELTVRDNLYLYGRYFDLPKAVLRERVDQLLEFAKLTERANDRVEPLSGGMRRRLTIARALISAPDVVILDEPTTGLDPQARHLLWDRLYRLKQEGVTLVITTHYMDEAEQLCDRLVVMDGGRIAAAGSPRELIERWSTREVVELRFEPGRHEEAGIAYGDLASRVEVLPDRVLLYTDDGDDALKAGPRPRRDAHRHARATLHARGRLLAPHGKDAGGLSATPMALRVYQYWWLSYKRTWRATVTSSFGYPVLYLAAIGVGLGQLIDKGPHGEIDGVQYLWFLAPGLLASTAMQIGTNEATFPVMAGIKWVKTYIAMLASPVGVDDVLYGHLAWITTRVAMSAAVFLAVMAAFGTVHSYWAILAFPAAVLTGAAFAAPVAAWSASRESEQSFIVLYRLGVIPLFLFSGTFFPISQLPGWLQLVARATPLYHGVQLCRAAVLGQPLGWSGVVDVAYLGVMLLVGLYFARRTFNDRLIQ